MSRFSRTNTISRPASRISLSQDSDTKVVDTLHEEHTNKPLLPYNSTDPNNLTIGEDGVIRFAYEEEEASYINTASQPKSSAFQVSLSAASIQRPTSRNEEPRSDVVSALEQERANKPLLPYDPNDPNNLTIGEDGMIRFALEEEVSTSIITSQSSSPYQLWISTCTIPRPASRNEKPYSDTVSALQQERPNKPVLLFNPVDPNNLTISEDGIIRFACEEETSPTSTSFDTDRRSCSLQSSETSILSADEDDGACGKARNSSQTHDSHTLDVQDPDAVVSVQGDQESTLLVLESISTNAVTEYLDIDTKQDGGSDPNSSSQPLDLKTRSNSSKFSYRTHHILDDPAVFLVQAPLSSEDPNDEIDEEEHFERLINNLRATAPEKVDTSFFDVPFSYRESLLQDLQDFKKTTTWYGRTDIFLDPAVMLVGKPQSVEKLDTPKARDTTKAHFAKLLAGLKHSATTDKHLIPDPADEMILDCFNTFWQGVDDLMFNDSHSAPYSNGEATIMAPQTRSSEEFLTPSIGQKLKGSYFIEKQDESEDSVSEKAHFAKLRYGLTQSAARNKSSDDGTSMTIPEPDLFDKTEFTSVQYTIKEESQSENKCTDDEDFDAEKLHFTELLSGLRKSTAKYNTPSPDSSNMTSDSIRDTPFTIRSMIASTQNVAELDAVEEKDNVEYPAESKAHFAKLLSGLRNSAANGSSSAPQSNNGTPILAQQSQPLSKSTVSNEGRTIFKAGSDMPAEAEIFSSTSLPTRFQTVDTKQGSSTDWITAGLFGDQSSSQFKISDEQIKAENHTARKPRNPSSSSTFPSSNKFSFASTGLKIQPESPILMDNAGNSNALRQTIDSQTSTVKPQSITDRITAGLFGDQYSTQSRVSDEQIRTETRASSDPPLSSTFPSIEQKTCSAAGPSSGEDSSQGETANEQVEQIDVMYTHQNPSLISTAGSTSPSVVFDDEILSDFHSRRTSVFDIFWDVDNHTESRFSSQTSDSLVICNERKPLEEHQIIDLRNIDPSWEIGYDFDGTSYNEFGYYIESKKDVEIASQDQTSTLAPVPTSETSLEQADTSWKNGCNFGDTSYSDSDLCLENENTFDTRSQSSTYLPELVEVSESLPERILEESPALSDDTPTYTEILRPVSIASSKFRIFSPEPRINRPLLRRKPKYSNLRNEHVKASLHSSSSLDDKSTEKAGAGAEPNIDRLLAHKPSVESSQTPASNRISGSQSDGAPATPTLRIATKAGGSSKRSKLAQSPNFATPMSRKQARQLKKKTECTPSSSNTSNYARHTKSSKAKVVDSPKSSPAQHPRVDELTKKFRRRSKTPIVEVDTRPLGPRPIPPLPRPVDTTPKVPSRLRPLRVASPVPETFAHVVNYQPLYAPEPQKPDLQHERIIAEVELSEESSILFNGYGSELVARLEEMVRHTELDVE